MISTIARTMATLAHLASEPKIIGMGPIITTPPPFVCVSVPPSRESIETATTMNPATTNTSPAETRSNPRMSGPGVR